MENKLAFLGGTPIRTERVLRVEGRSVVHDPELELLRPSCVACDQDARGLAVLDCVRDGLLHDVEDVGEERLGQGLRKSLKDGLHADGGGAGGNTSGGAAGFL